MVVKRKTRTFRAGFKVFLDKIRITERFLMSQQLNHLLQ
ncbi:hypothetical protein FM107_04855 [Sphingobacterium sp. JB170]|nr:hypothetical protein FM107_04855 [Sphingobacterium sp. JB170]